MERCGIHKIVCNVRPQKEEVNRTRFTFRGNNLSVPMDYGTPTADLLTLKFLLNSVVSFSGAKFMTLDLKDFYLNIPMECFEFLQMKIDHFPQDVINYYCLKEKIDDEGYLLVCIKKGMYDLPEAGIIAQKLLEKHLEEQGYRQSATTLGYWNHDWRQISFLLVIVNFGVKYVGKEHANHRLSVLRKFYIVEKTRKAVSIAAL